MADRTLSSVAALALIAAAAATPAAAHTRHHSAPHHRTSETRGSRHAKKPVEHHSAAPSGVTAVPAGGLKIYCPARKTPLLIRKSTQGAGTTVTAVCR
ncbi:hypothetical protein [uncultured Sphingomonas sp.]|uniref:hypothetical protein n=1 Tax=uncultured Sphingomonas sp. TaxID=158754 RepID=UPI00260732CD|nr:hypothetical protein [uncultured Sphingomonas sp.]